MGPSGGDDCETATLLENRQGTCSVQPTPELKADAKSAREHLLNLGGLGLAIG
jgi:hypothetical protein